MANQLLAKAGEKKPRPTIEQFVSGHLLNPELSDVCFVVGEEREKIHAHRFFLAAESEVFKSMFYGEMRESRLKDYEIVVPDLSPVGFRNMLKYFYSKRVEIDLSEMNVTYMAANKYLASNLIEDLTDHIIKNCLNVANVCVIYDQLLKLAISESLIGEVKLSIATKFSEACASDSFLQIDEDTLVSILNFSRLNIGEFELLKVCLRWADSEAARRDSARRDSARRDSAVDAATRRRVFEPIKHLIRFGDLSLSEFGSVSNIELFLTAEEIGWIFLQVSHKNAPIQIDYRSPRRACSIQVANAVRETMVSGRASSVNYKYLISVDKRVVLSSIATFTTSVCSSLSFEISRDEGNGSSGPKVLAGQLTNSGWFIDFSQLSLILEPNVVYKLKFSLSIQYNYYPHHDYSFNASNQMTLKSDEAGVVFKIESDFGKHFIEMISFSGPFE